MAVNKEFITKCFIKTRSLQHFIFFIDKICLHINTCFHSRIKGVEGLRIVDVSDMPTILWSNTNIPTIMVAEKASDIIKSTIHCNPVSYQDN